MKQNISLAATGCQKLTAVDSEHRLCTVCEKFVAVEVAPDAPGKGWRDYVVQIGGGNDKQRTMKQGVNP